MIIGHRLPGIWLRTGIAGLQSAGVSAETSSLFLLAEELPPDFDAGFVRMSQGLRRNGSPDCALDAGLCECLRDWPPGPREMTQRNDPEKWPREMIQRNDPQK